MARNHSTFMGKQQIRTPFPPLLSSPLSSEAQTTPSTHLRSLLRHLHLVRTVNPLSNFLQSHELRRLGLRRHEVVRVEWDRPDKVCCSSTWFGQMARVSHTSRIFPVFNVDMK